METLIEFNFDIEKVILLTILATIIGMLVQLMRK